MQVRKCTATKITTWIDNDVLAKLRAQAKDLDVPYQRLLNHLVRESLGLTPAQGARIDALEREVALLRDHGFPV